MATITSLATEWNAQPYEVAAFLDLGRDYNETAELDESTEAFYREAWAAGLDAVSAQH